MIVDGDMDIFPAIPTLLARAWVRLTGTIPRNTVTGLLKAPEFLDIEMDDFARAFTFITMYRLGRIKVFEA